MKRLLLLKPIQQSLLLVVMLLLSIEANVGQAISVLDRVTAKNNEGIPAATVLVKGTTTGTASGADGSYTISVPGPNSVLVFSSVGYLGQEVTVEQSRWRRTSAR